MKKKEDNVVKWVIGVAIFVGIIIAYGYFTTTSDREEQKELKSNSDGTYDWESYYGDDWEGYLQEELEEEGYEVMEVLVMDVATSPAMAIYFGDSDKINCEGSTANCISNKKTINVQMKSLGSRADQIKRVVFDSLLMENIYGYWIDILSPTDTCTYVIKLDDWRSCDYPCNLDKFVTEDSLLLCE